MHMGLGYVIFSIIAFEGINDFGVKEQSLFFCRYHICLNNKTLLYHQNFVFICFVSRGEQ